MMQVLDDLIEEIAKALCVAEGIDPESSASYGYLDSMTDRERAEWAKQHRGVPLVAIKGPTWKLYRRVAASIIAQRKIMKQFGEKIDAQIEQEA